jgi:dTMP kinase
LMTNRKTPYVALEGIDGVGKSTLAHRLSQVLADRYKLKCLTTHDPGTSTLGRFIQERWHDGMQLSPVAWTLLFAAESIDAQKRQGGVRDQLAAGKVVVSDRCAMSTLAYFLRDVELAWMLRVHDLYRYPDVVIVLDLDPEKAVRRQQLRDGARCSSAQLGEAIRRATLLRTNYLEVARELQSRDVRIVFLPIGAEDTLSELTRHASELVAAAMTTPYDPNRLSGAI